MTFRIAQESLLVGKEPVGFTQNYFYEWDDGLGGATVQLFLNFTLPWAEAPGDEIGELIFEVMKNYFFHNLERDAGARFEDMLKEINHVVRGKEEELQVKFIPKAQVIVAAISGETLFLAQHGFSEGYLIRKRYVSNLTDGLSDPKNEEDLFTNIASGELHTGDFVLLSSTRLLRYITQSDLGRLMAETPQLNTALEAISDAVSLDLTEQMSVMGIHVQEKLPEPGAGDEKKEEVLERVETGSWKAEKALKTLGMHWGKAMASFKLHLGKLIRKREEQQEVEKELAQEEVEKEMPKGQSLFSPITRVFKEWKELKRDRILLTLIVVVVALLVGTYLVRHQGQKHQYITELETKLETVELNINTAKTTGAYDKETAQVLLDEAEVLALEVLNSGYLRAKASEYLTEIEEQRDYLDNVTRIEVPTVFVDFTAKNSNMNALGILPFDDHFYVYEYNQLYEVILDQIEDPVQIDDEEVVIDASYYEEEDAIMFLTKAGRVIEYADGQFSFVDTADLAWHTGVAIHVYNSRIYILDSVNGQVWKYSPSRDGYGSAEGYITDDTDIKGAQSIAIDGTVYVLQDDGTLVQFSSGENTDFLVKKAPAADLSGATVVHAELDMSQVFVLDPSTSRVLVYIKDARSGDLVYSRQYVFENAEDLRDVYFDKEANRIYVLGKTKVYQIDY